ncbi:MAG: type II secretion system secretin GspD [Proteobacteria bacterium]|nr:type II secretion system secretin GspD [Pseudomonadota bacterium]MBU1686368.1 type II secretion system secretin GspD [Pseudomonadota bacterium]
MKKITIGLALLLTLLGGGFPAGAEEPAMAEGRIMLNFQDVEINAVISSVSKLTGRTFIVDPRVKGKVTIISNQEVDEKELYPIFLSILHVNEFAAIEGEGVTKIVPLARVKDDSTEFDGDTPTPGRFGDSMVTRLYKLKHIPADRLVAILRPLVPTKSYLAAQPDSNMIIMTDRVANIDRLVKIIQQIDQARDGNVEVIKLEHADARDVVQVIQNLENPAQKAANGTDQLRLIADERTNSILLTGNDYDIDQLQAIIAHLDKPIETEGDTRVIFLRFAKAKDMLPILQGMDPSKNPALRKGVPPPPANQQEQVNIQADEATNALIITASPALLQSLQSVIRTLDIRRAQVLIEAIIAEVQTGKGAELGVQWRANSVKSSDRSGIIGGTNFSSASSPGINVVSASPATALASMNGFNLGYLSGSATFLGNEILNLGSLLSALASDGNSNILSTPSLVTMDNKEAEITVGNNVPFATGSYTSTGSSNPQNPFTTYERKDVGLKLKVTPQINEGDTIRLDLEQEVSSLTSSATDSTVGLQTTATRSIKTSVMVEDGKVLVLGGLIYDDVQESQQSVPILGSIPLLGWLFRYNKTTHNKQNLMVFLRPTIMRTSESGQSITFDKYDYMRRLQENFAAKGVNLLPNEAMPSLPDHFAPAPEVPADAE